MWCPEPDSNRHIALAPRDFKSESPFARQYHVEDNEANSEGFYAWRVRFGASGFRRIGHKDGHSLGTNRPATWHAYHGLLVLRLHSFHGAKTKRRIPNGKGTTGGQDQSGWIGVERKARSQRAADCQEEVGLPASTVHTILSKAHGWAEIADEPVFRQNRAQQNGALEQATRTMAAIERVEDKIDEAAFYHLTLGETKS